jgi:hypothetical protein
MIYINKKNKNENKTNNITQDMYIFYINNK